MEEAEDAPLLGDAAPRKPRPPTMRGAKALYFFQWAQSASMFNYLALYLSSRDLTPTGVGVALTACMVGSTLGASIGPACAEATGRQFSTVIGAMLGSAAVAAVVACDVVPKELLVPTLMLMQLLWAASRPIVDAAVLELLAAVNAERDAERETFGHQRVWGILGYGLCALGIGTLVGSARALRDTFAIFALLAPFTIAGFALLPRAARAGDAEAPPAAGGGAPGADAAAPKPPLGWAGALAAARELLAVPPMAPFFAATVVGGALFATMVQYVWLWLTEDLGASYALVGLATVATNCAELPMVFHAQRVLARVGMHGVLALSCVGYAVRCAVYLTISTPWLVLLAEPFHALSFSLAIATTGVYARHAARAHAPRAAGPLVQGALQAAACFGRALGFIGGALVREYYSWHVLWLAVAALTAVYTTVVAAFHAAHRRPGMAALLHPT